MQHKRHKDNKNLWKGITLTFILIFSFIYALPNLYGDDPAVLISTKNQKSFTYAEQNLIQAKIATLKSKAIKSELKKSKTLLRFSNTDLQLQARDKLQSLLQKQDNLLISLNLASKTPSWLRSIGAKPMKLGLDLRGGVHFLLEVDTDSMIATRMNADTKLSKQTLRKARIRYIGFQNKKNKPALIYFRNQKDLNRAKETLADKFPDYQFKVNNNPQSYNLEMIFKTTALDHIIDYAIEQNITVLNNRINELGVAEAAIQRQGRNQVSVDLPGIQDTGRAKELIGKTASLRFQMVNALENHDNSSLSDRYVYRGSIVPLIPEPILTGSSITYANSSFQEGQPVVNIHLGGGGEGLFYKTTANNIGKPMAVVYSEIEMQKKLINGISQNIPIKHDRIISVATIQSALGNQFVITGLSSPHEAENLALLLRSGALAAPVHFVQELTIGPSMGQANINKGILSLSIGCLAIVIFMILYYRVFGIIANLAIAFNILLIVAILSILDATLTLPGIAGIVLTVGMAVDSNVLINERIREELRLGLHPLSAIQAGYERAFSTIVDANVTTLIVAMILFGLASGMIKGFAICLTIGLLCSMLTAVTFTRIIIELFYHNPKLKKLSIGI
jgi:preprotein translocase subunit SecD